jgi:hypothetical protein
LIEFKSLGEITLIRVERDIITMSEDEMDLLLQLIATRFQQTGSLVISEKA